MRAFNSPIWFLWLRNTLRIRKFNFMHTKIMTGMIINMISVSKRLIRTG